MRFVSYLIALAVAVLGFVFLVGSQGQVSRLIIGIVLLIAAAVIVYLGRSAAAPGKITTTQQIDLSGDVSLEEFRCRSCNAPLSKEQIDVKAGAIFVECDHCGATYQVEEEPKW
ncbi:MAG TPA: hypothetical protein VFI27_14675 [candidate division Zixibacteria bacterium]|nr:hypothetical protein [candidate division Zixibacteria bacterium]